MRVIHFYSVQRLFHITHSLHSSGEATLLCPTYSSSEQLPVFSPMWMPWKNCHTLACLTKCLLWELEPIKSLNCSVFCRRDFWLNWTDCRKRQKPPGSREDKETSGTGEVWAPGCLRRGGGKCLVWNQMWKWKETAFIHPHGALLARGMESPLERAVIQPWICKAWVEPLYPLVSFILCLLLRINK